MTDLIDITITQWNASNCTGTIVDWAGQATTSGIVLQPWNISEAILFGPEIESDYPVQDIAKSIEDIGERIPVTIWSRASRAMLLEYEKELRRCLRAFNGDATYKYIHVSDFKETFVVNSIWKAEGSVEAAYPGKNVI